MTSSLYQKQHSQKGPSPKKLLSNSKKEAIFRLLQQSIPHPQTELIYRNHFTLLVAVVLSAQSTDVAVNKATEALFAKVDTPEAMVQLGEINLKSYIKTIGLYHAKARHIIGLSEQLIARHQSQVPNSLADLMALPGVGIKTAKVVLSCAFGVPTIAVDTHVHRVSNRLGLVCTDTPAQTQKIIDEAVPAAYLQDAHHLLILHGRYCCKARKPDCAQCCLAELCQSKMLKWSEIVPDA